MPIFFFLAACLSNWPTAWAQGATITSILTSRRLHPVQAFELTSREMQGDVVEYCATYFNGGEADIDGVSAVLPVPPGSTFIAGSAWPARQMEVSADAITFKSLTLIDRVPMPEGNEERTVAALAAYRAVRWDLGSLPAGASAVVRLRVRMDSTVTPPSTRP